MQDLSEKFRKYRWFWLNYSNQNEGYLADFYDLTALFFVGMEDNINFATLQKKNKKNGKS